MAKTSKSEAGAPAIDPNADYRIVLKRTVRIGKAGTTVLAPHRDNRVKGKVLSTILGDVVRYERVAPAAGERA